MKFFLINLLSILLAVNPAFSQVIEGKQAQNVLAPTNYVRNALAEKAESTADIVDASNILTVSSSSPIEGKKSFNIDATTTAEVIKFINDPIQQVLIGQNCEANFSYFGDASLYKAYVEQGGTKLTYTEQTLLNTGSITQVYRVNFPCGSSIAANNIVIESTGNGAAIKADKFYAGEATNITNQVVVTDWQDFPSVAAGTLITATTNPTYGTVVTNKAQWRRVGGNMEIKWDFRSTTAGTTGSGIMLFNLPPGFQIDTTKVKANNGTGALSPSVSDSTVGTFSGIYQDASNGRGDGSVAVFDSTRLRAFLQSTATTGTVSYARNWEGGFYSFDVPMQLSINASVPIVGWSATQSAITQQCIQDGSCENTFSAKVSSAGVVSDENIDWINGNAVISPTGAFTLTLRPSFFGATPNCVAANSEGTGGVGLNASYDVANSTASTIVVRTANGGTAANYRFNLICQRSSTDYKPRFTAPALVGSVTSNSTSALRVETIKYGGASESTVCTSGTCTLYGFGNNGWASSITRSGTGGYTLNISSGVFSSRPNCFGSFSNNSNTIAQIMSMSSDTTLAFSTSSLSALVDTHGSIFCIGPR